LVEAPVPEVPEGVVVVSAGFGASPPVRFPPVRGVLEAPPVVPSGPSVGVRRFPPVRTSTGAFGVDGAGFFALAGFASSPAGFSVSLSVSAVPLGTGAGGGGGGGGVGWTSTTVFGGCGAGSGVPRRSQAESEQVAINQNIDGRMGSPAVAWSPWIPVTIRWQRTVPV